MLRKIFTISFVFVVSFISFFSLIKSYAYAGVMHSTRIIPKASIDTFVPLYGPRDVAVDENGNIYITDGDFNRVKKVNSNGRYLTQWGTAGYDEKEFQAPFGIDFDSRGVLYVVDGANDRIQLFTKNGTFIKMFGSTGQGDGQFNFPMAIFIDHNDFVYIADTNNNRIQKFDREGNFIMKFGVEGQEAGDFFYPIGIYVDENNYMYISDSGNGRIQKFDSNANYIMEFGNEIDPETEELLPSSFSSPNGINRGPDGALYISDMNNERVLKYSINGEFLGIYLDNLNDETIVSMPHGIDFMPNGDVVIANWGLNEVRAFNSLGETQLIVAAHGDSPELLYSPSDFVIRGSTIYVADNGNNKIKKFDFSGNLLGSFGTEGSGEGEFSSPYSLEVDSSGNIYVYDSGNSRIQKYDNNGNILLTFGEEGWGEGSISNIEGVHVDADGEIFLMNNSRYVVMKYDALGNFFSEFGGSGNQPGKLNLILGGGIAPNGNVYVADGFNHRISVFDNDGNFLETFGGTAPAEGGFSLPGDIDFAPNGDVYIVDPNGNKIHRFNSSHEYIASWGELGGRVGEMYYPYGIEVTSTGDVYTLSDSPSDSGFVTKWGMGYQIANIPEYLDVRSNENSVKAGSRWGVNGVLEDSSMTFSDHRTSDFTVDLTTDRDWSAVDASMNFNTGKSYLANLNPVDAPGVSATHSLYVPKLVNQVGVYICPNANSLEEVALNCPGGYSLQSGDANVSVYVDGIFEYWVISGLTGTGGLGLSISAPTARLVLTPNESDENISQEVLITYTPTIGFQSADKIQFHFEPIAGFVLSNTCVTPTTDADGDSSNDGSATIITDDIYEYTFSDTIVAAELEFCVVVTAPATAESYSVRLTDDNGNFDSAMYYVGDDNDVFVIANVMPSLSFNIRTLADDADTNVCNFGTVSSSAPIPNYNDQADIASECGYSLAVGTNAVGGFQTQIVADGPLNGAGGSIADLSNGGSFTAGVESYGFANITQSASGRNQLGGLYTESILRNGNFNLAANTGTSIPTTIQTMLTYDNGVQYTAGVDNVDVTRVVHGIVIGSGTPAGYYDQVITYTTTANF